MAKEKDILIDIGNLIRKKMRAKFKSNLALATACDIDEKTVRNVLAGENISLRLLKRICDALDVKVSDVLKEAGY